MALTHVTAARNAIADAVVGRIDVGAGANGTMELKAGATVLVVLPFAATAFGAAAGGVATATSLPRTAAAIAAGTADGFTVKNADGNEEFSGTVSSTAAGTGDVQLDNTSITNGQNVSLDTCTYTAPA